MKEDRDFLLIKKTHLEFSENRDVDKTYCPSEVARKLYPNNWRDKMDLVRKVANTLVESGTLITLQKGENQSELPSKIKGPIRLRKKVS